MVGAPVAFAASCNLSGEDVQCDDMAVAGLRVTVVNGVGSNGECDVAVVAADGAYTETLQCHAESSVCKCWGAQERPGTYHVTATRADGATATKTVTVFQGPCGVSPQFITLALP